MRVQGRIRKQFAEIGDRLQQRTVIGPARGPQPFTAEIQPGGEDQRPEKDQRHQGKLQAALDVSLSGHESKRFLR